MWKFAFGFTIMHFIESIETYDNTLFIKINMKNTAPHTHMQAQARVDVSPYLWILNYN